MIASTGAMNPRTLSQMQFRHLWSLLTAATALETGSNSDMEIRCPKNQVISNTPFVVGERLGEVPIIRSCANSSR